ncbi:MAG: hypothetical protein EON95_21055 [Caulobacteraceae bacterium]|nr:MAG: hypothetical protein EON95_21055 [Caulobacteraceae bacterium]
MTPDAPSTPARSHRARRAVALWHLAAAAATAALAGAARWLRPDMDWAILIGLWASVVPGLAGLFLWRRDGWAERVLAMGGWSVAAVATSALAGGVTGPLAGLVFLPLAAGIVLGGRGRAGPRSGRARTGPRRPRRAGARHRRPGSGP